MWRELIRPVRVAAVGRNTFREAVRNRAFLGLVLFAVAFILSSLLMAELAVVGEHTRVVTDFGFFAVGLFAATTAIVMGALLVHKEIEKKTIYTIISKPIRRYEFILGKYAGLVAILVVEIAFLTFVWAGALALQGGEWGLEHLKGMLLVAFEVGLVASVAVMFSAATTPVFTALFSLGVFAVGRTVYLIEEMLQGDKGPFVDNPVARAFGTFVVAVFPDLSVFNVSQQVLLDVAVPWTYLGHAFLYAAAYGAFALGVAMLAFERRDFV
ncbi:MAG: ABC transporter permease [Myxococcota bacterium]